MFGLSEKWTKVVGAAAPTILSAIVSGGVSIPLALNGVREVAKIALDEPEAEIKKKPMADLIDLIEQVTPTANIQTQLKAREHVFKANYGDILEDLLAAQTEQKRIAAEDRADARDYAEKTGDKTPRNLIYIQWFVLSGTILGLFMSSVNEWDLEIAGTYEILLMIVGHLLGEVSKGSNYLYGTNEKSGEKTRMIAGIAQKVGIKGK